MILFDNAGVSSSSGEVPTSIEEMAQHAAAFIDPRWWLNGSNDVTIL